MSTDQARPDLAAQIEGILYTHGVDERMPSREAFTELVAAVRALLDQQPPPLAVIPSPMTAKNFLASLGIFPNTRVTTKVFPKEEHIEIGDLLCKFALHVYPYHFAASRAEAAPPAHPDFKCFVDYGDDTPPLTKEEEK